MLSDGTHGAKLCLQRARNGSIRPFRLEFSSGSANELVTPLTILKSANRLPNYNPDRIIVEIREINSMIRGLMNALNTD